MSDLKRQFPIPGLEKYPDLADQFLAATARAGCKSCDQAPVLQKFSKLVSDRDRRDASRTPLR